MEKKVFLFPDRIFTISNFFDNKECDEYIALSENIGYEIATINAIEGHIVRLNTRNNTRVILDDFSIAERIWKRLKPFTPEVVENRPVIGINERFRFYRYDPGQYFKLHYDGCYRRANGEVSQLTLMIYLNDDFSGGETHFNLNYPNDDVVIKPEKGMALCFDHYLLHEGCDLIKGRKYVLRSDIMYGDQDFNLKLKET
jgi:hypothetical protein